MFQLFPKAKGILLTIHFPRSFDSIRLIDPMMMDRSSVAVIMRIAENRSLPEATGIATGDVVQAPPWVEAEVVTMIDAEDMMTDVEDMTVAVVAEDTIATTMTEREVSTEEEATMTTEVVVSIITTDKVAAEEDTTTTIVVAVDLIPSEEVVLTESQPVIAEVLVVCDLDCNSRAERRHFRNNQNL